MKLRNGWLITAIAATTAVAAIILPGLAGCSTAPISGSGTTFGNSAGLPTLAEFGSDTCIPCKEMQPILQDLTVQYRGRLKVMIVDVYEQPNLARQFRIMTIPTQILFDGEGKLITRHVGVWPKAEIVALLTEMGI